MISLGYVSDKELYRPYPKDPDFPGKKGEFIQLDSPSHTVDNMVYFSSQTSDSFFEEICIDFGTQSISVASKSKYRDQFRSYFCAYGIPNDNISLSFYSAQQKEDLQRLCKILWLNNLFPSKWQTFFLSLGASGKWPITSKAGIDKLEPSALYAKL